MKDVLLEFGNSDSAVDYVDDYYNPWRKKNNNHLVLIKLESDINIIQYKNCQCPDTMFHIRYFFKNFKYTLSVIGISYKATNPNLYFQKIELSIYCNFVILHLSRCENPHNFPKSHHHINCTGDFPWEKIYTELELLTENLKICHKKFVAGHLSKNPTNINRKEDFIFDGYDE